MHAHTDHPNWFIHLAISVCLILTLCASLTGSVPGSAAGLYRSSWEPRLPASVPVLVEPGAVTSISLVRIPPNPDRLFMNRSCGGELYGPPTYVRYKIPPTGSTQMLNYFSDACAFVPGMPHHIASVNVAADANRVYWLSTNGFVAYQQYIPVPVGLPQPLVLTAATPLTHDPVAYSLAVDDTYVYWHEDNHFYRFRKDQTGPKYTLNATAAVPHNLSSTNDGRLFFIENNQLKVMFAWVYPYDINIVADRVQDFSITGERIYLARNWDHYYEIASVALDTYGDYQRHYTSPLVNLTVESLAVGGSSAYWHEKSGLTGGPIYGMQLPAGGALPLTSPMRTVASLVTDGSYLYWTDRLTGVYRLDPVSPPPPPPTYGDISILAPLHVTQSIQAGTSDIPMVANHQTVVRARVQAVNDSRGPWTDVVARLEMEDSSRVHYDMHRFTLPTAGSDLADWGQTFNFFLDPEETLPGTREITVTVFSVSGRRETNLTNNIAHWVVAFGPPSTLEYSGLSYSHNGPQSGCPPGDAPAGIFTPVTDYPIHAQYATNLLPFSRVLVIPIPGVAPGIMSNSDCRAYEHARLWASGIVDRAYPGGGRRAVVIQPETLGGGTSCNLSALNCVINMQNHFPNRTLAHETAHTYGGVFIGSVPPGCCHTFQAGMHYPRFPSGALGPFYGLKLYPNVEVVNGFALPPDDVSDLMSYDANRWTSPYTYCRVLNYRSGGSLSCPPWVDPTTTRPASAPVKQNAVQVKPGVHTSTDKPQDNLPYLYVSGWFSPTGEANFAPFEIINSSLPIGTPNSGQTYALKLLDGNGVALTEVDFDLSPAHEDPPSKQDLNQLFSAYLPWTAGAQAVTLEPGSGDLLARRDVSLNAPTVKIGAFSPPDPAVGTQKLTWTADDADGDELTFSVWYSPDNGATWLPLAVQLIAKSYEVNFDQLPGSGSAQGVLRVLASDGVLTGEALTGNFTVPNKPPEIDIQKSTADGQSAYLSATAVDLEDGAILNPKLYQWSSNWDGGVGDGQDFNPARLTPGEHILTLTVTDSQGLSASKTSNVTSPGTPDASGSMVSNLGGLLIFDPFMPMTLSVPPNAVEDLTHFQLKLSSDTFFDPPNTLGSSFVIGASTLGGDPVTDFTEHPLTLQITYNDLDLGGMDEHGLRLYTYNEASLQWEAMPAQVDTLLNQVTVSLPHLSRFVLLSGPLHIYLPVVKR